MLSSEKFRYIALSISYIIIEFHMQVLRYAVFSVLICLFSCYTQRPAKVVYISDLLQIERVAADVYVHISYLDIPGYGPFPCNGLIYFDGDEALVFDTPVQEAAAEALLAWIEREKKRQIIGVVINHFHVDCLGSLSVFHARGIPSYAHQKTIDLATAEHEILPSVGFKDQLVLEVGRKEVINAFLGEGHTRDNIVSFLPAKGVLFGGCLIKSDGAGKGNLADANVDEWANTVSRVKEKFPGVRWVVPGHGPAGGTVLLDYTIRLFGR